MSDRPDLSPELRERLYSTIYWVAQADGVSAEERVTLARLRDALGLDAAASGRLERETDGPPARIDDPAAQRALCCVVAQVVASDRKLSPAERERVDALQQRLGLDRAALEKAIQDRLMGAPRS
jgi:tellurite resistance protein